MEPPLLNAGDLIPWVVPHVASGPDGKHVSQMLYDEGSRAYPFHQVLCCMSENVVPLEVSLPLVSEPPEFELLFG
jgi:hypothetical protein